MLLKLWHEIALIQTLWLVVLNCCNAPKYLHNGKPQFSQIDTKDKWPPYTWKASCLEQTYLVRKRFKLSILKMVLQHLQQPTNILPNRPKSHISLWHEKDSRPCCAYSIQSVLGV